MTKFNFVKVLRASVAGFALLAAGQVSAASLLTSGAGYVGPVIDLSAFDTPFYTFSEGPIALPGGITYTSEASNSVLGRGGYGLADNGNATTALIIGTNSGSAAVTLTFDTAVSSFGGGFNYAVSGGQIVGDAPTISAFDESGGLIAEYDLAALASISTPGATNAFAFRGIDGGGTAIKSFVFAGSFIILGAAPAVPEPASWALMISGFGLAGAAARRRSTKVAFA